MWVVVDRPLQGVVVSHQLLVQAPLMHTLWRALTHTHTHTNSYQFSFCCTDKTKLLILFRGGRESVHVCMSLCVCVYVQIHAKPTMYEAAERQAVQSENPGIHPQQLRVQETLEWGRRFLLGPVEKEREREQRRVSEKEVCVCVCRETKMSKWRERGSPPPP